MRRMAYFGAKKSLGTWEKYRLKTIYLVIEH